MGDRLGTPGGVSRGWCFFVLGSRGSKGTRGFPFFHLWESVASCNGTEPKDSVSSGLCQPACRGWSQRLVVRIGSGSKFFQTFRFFMFFLVLIPKKGVPSLADRVPRLRRAPVRRFRRSLGPISRARPAASSDLHQGDQSSRNVHPSRPRRPGKSKRIEKGLSGSCAESPGGALPQAETPPEISPSALPSQPVD